MIKLKHLYEYNELLKEAKNTYQVKINDKNTGSEGDYRTSGQVFKQAVVLSLHILSKQGLHSKFK